MYKENYYGFRLTCLRLNKYIFSDCDGCTWCVDVYLASMRLRSYFKYSVDVLIGCLNVTAIQMSRSDLAVELF